jgi:hypothetical protein
MVNTPKFSLMPILLKYSLRYAFVSFIGFEIIIWGYLYIQQYVESWESTLSLIANGALILVVLAALFLLLKNYRATLQGSIVSFREILPPVILFALFNALGILIHLSVYQQGLPGFNELQVMLLTFIGLSAIGAFLASFFMRRKTFS